MGSGLSHAQAGGKRPAGEGAHKLKTETRKYSKGKADSEGQGNKG